MKKILVVSMLFFSLLLSIDADAQKMTVKEWIEAKKLEAKAKADAKINQKASEGIDAAVNTPEKMIKKTKEKKNGKKTKTKYEVVKETNTKEAAKETNPDEVVKETPSAKVEKETNTDEVEKETNTDTKTETENKEENKPTKEEADPLADPNDPDYYKNHPVIKTNIKCEAGKTKMIKILKDLDGVFEVKINSKTGILNLHYSDGGTPLKDIVEEITSNGFDVLSVYDGYRDTEVKKTTKPSANPCKK